MNTGRIDDNGGVRGEAPAASANEEHSDSPTGEGAEGPNQPGGEGREHRGKSTVPAASGDGATARHTLLRQLRTHIMIDVVAIRHSRTRRVIRPEKVARLAESI